MTVGHEWSGSNYAICLAASSDAYVHRMMPHLEACCQFCGSFDPTRTAEPPMCEDIFLFIRTSFDVHSRVLARDMKVITRRIRSTSA